MSEQGSPRYPRTFGGLIGSMIVLVLVVVPIVLLTHVWGDARRTTEGIAPVTPPVDYRAVVQQVQQSGQTLVYPTKVPAGWNVTSADWDIITDPTSPQWRLGVVTADKQFVGFYEQNAPGQTLAAQTVGQHAKQGADVTIPTAVGRRWTSWTDSSGDLGYSTAVGKHTLVVYGTTQADVRTFMATLTNAPLPHSRQS